MSQNREEEILHQRIAETWRNTHRPLDPDGWQMQRLICHWNNGETGRSGNKMVTMGVKKGVADWQWLKEDGRSIWIELKTATGTQGPEQKKFQKLCEALGHEYVICRDYEAFWKICGIPEPC